MRQTVTGYGNREEKNLYRKGERKNNKVLDSLIRRQIPASLDLMEEKKLSEFSGFAINLLKKIYFTIYKKYPKVYNPSGAIPCAPTQLLRITKVKVL